MWSECICHEVIFIMAECPTTETLHLQFYFTDSAGNKFEFLVNINFTLRYRNKW